LVDWLVSWLSERYIPPEGQCRLVKIDQSDGCSVGAKGR